jgi:hypothetical protein
MTLHRSQSDPDALSADRIKQHVLQLEQVGTSAVVDRVNLQRMDVRVTEEFVAGSLRASLYGYVLSERLAEDTVTESVCVPATWVDHAKDALREWVEERDLRARPVYWLLRRWPVRHREVTLTATWHRAATRPMSTLQVDSLGPVVYQERSSHHLDGV